MVLIVSYLVKYSTTDEKGQGMLTKSTENIELVYDEQCPVCSTYCNNLKVDSNVNLSLIDARKDSKIMDEITKRGLDIDKGMVLNIDGTMYYSSDAMREIAIRSQKKGWLALPNRLFFNTKIKADFFYSLGKIFRSIILRVLDIDDIHNLKPKNTLKKQLGERWQKLNPNIQKRFETEPTLGKATIYEGSMLEMRRSFMGWLFASLTKIIGNPLSSYEGTNVPMEVALFKKPNKEGVYWQRTYLIPNKKPYVVVSSKQESKAGEMLECVGGGFGMKLHVYEENQELHFKSYRYFWKVLKYKIPLPNWLTPGQTHVIHTDLGNGEFTYTISMTHQQLGQTFYQHGVFHCKGETKWN